MSHNDIIRAQDRCLYEATMMAIPIARDEPQTFINIYVASSLATSVLQDIRNIRGEWQSGLYSLRQVTEVKLGRVRSNSGWVTSGA